MRLDCVIRAGRLIATLLILTASVPAQVSSGPESGTLVVVGGGRVGPEIWNRFIELAGGPVASIVYIPTAAEDQGISEKGFYDSGSPLAKMKNVTLLHTRDRAVADSEEFVEPLRKATGVWFGGGRQWRLVDSYFNTRTQREIENVLRRGGVIGGSSAGASIQASYLVRGAPEGNHIMMAKGYEAGFGYLKNVAVDQHLNTRKRENDLAAVIRAHPELLGIGIDESTAIVVRSDRFEVIGVGRVAITDGGTHDGKPYYLLGRGDRFDLTTRSRLR